MPLSKKTWTGLAVRIAAIRPHGDKCVASSNGYAVEDISEDDYMQGKRYMFGEMVSTIADVLERDDPKFVREAFTQLCND